MQQKTLLKIIEVIQEYTLIKNVTDFKLKRRYIEIVLTRQLACYYLKKLTHLTHKQIAQLMGGIDRTTVIHSIKNINTMLEINQDPLYNSDFRERVKNMEDKIVDVLVNNFKEQQRYQTRAERKIYTLQNELNASNNMIRLLQEKLNRLEHPYMTA